MFKHSRENRKSKPHGIHFYVNIGLAIFVLAIVLLVVVHICSRHVSSLITADGMLDYIINGIAAMATYVLAVVAIIQNDRANDAAEKANETAERANEFAEKADKRAEEEKKRADAEAERADKEAKRADEARERELEARREANELTKQANAIAKQANALSEKLESIEENRYKIDLRPFVMVMGIKAYLLDQATIFKAKKLYIQIGEADDFPCIGLALQLTNVTQNFVMVSFNDGLVEKDDTKKNEDDIKLKQCYVNQSIRKIGIAPGQTKEVILYATKKFMQNLQHKWISVNLVLENRFAKRYGEGFRVLITSLTDTVSHAEDEWFCASEIQNYTIGEFIDGKLVLEEL